MLVFFPSGMGAASIPEGPFAFGDNDLNFHIVSTTFEIACMITSGTVHISHETEMTKQILVKCERALTTKTPTLIPIEPNHDDK